MRIIGAIFFFLLTACRVFAQAPIISYTPATLNYTVSTAITPLTPANTGGAVPPTVYGMVSTLAGSGVAGENNGAGTSATFNYPMRVTIDKTGNVYVTDVVGNSVRKITPSGTVTTLATAVSPKGITIDNSDNIYVSDNNTDIKKITPAGIVSTVLNSANAPGITNLTGLTLDASGTFYIVDFSTIKKAPSLGTAGVSTIAGNTSQSFADGLGTQAKFSSPYDVAVDAAGNLFIADQANNRIRKIAPDGYVSTIAGNGTRAHADGNSSSSSFNYPSGICTDAAGNVYVADQLNNLIRMVSPAGITTTIAGNISFGSSDGIGTSATFGNPTGIVADNLGHLFVADLNNQKIRKISLLAYTINKPLPPGLVFDTAIGKISGTPTTVSPLTAYTITAYNNDGSSTTIVNIAVNALPNAPPNTAAPDIHYTSPQTYTVNNPIMPLAPTNTGGAITPSAFGTAYYAGAYTRGNLNGPPGSAQFDGAYGIATDVAGNLYISDNNNKAIRKVATGSGIVTTYVSNFPNIPAPFSSSYGITVDAAGNLYVADAGNNQILKISPAQVVTVLAGSGTFGSANGTGAAASFANPEGIAVDGAGNVYVSDTKNNLIRKITPAGVVTTIAGKAQIPGADNGVGNNATFNNPKGIVVDAAGNLYVADYGNNLIRKIAPNGTVSTFAGSGAQASFDNTGTIASFNNPYGIAIDAAGNLYVTDQTSGQIRKITPAAVVTTLASTITPYQIAVDGAGNIYVANDIAIKKVANTGYTIDKPLPPGLSFDTSTGIISGTPTAVSPLDVYTIVGTNAYGSSVTTVSIQVTAAALLPSVITFPVIPQNSIDANNNLTPGATSTNNETPIIYTSDNPAVATITANGLIHIIGPGVVHITATQAGNANYSAATPVTQILTLIEIQHITLPAISAKTTCSTDFSLNATSTSSSTIPITYTSSNLNVATVSAQGLVHIVGPGTSTITINQAGSAQYSAAQPQSQLLNVTVPANPTVNITPGFYGSCLGLAVTYTATATNPGTNQAYQWQINGTDVIGATTTIFTSSTLHTNDAVTCNYTSTNICGTTTKVTSNTASLTAAPYTTPAISIQTATNVPVCSGTPITFTATTTNEGNIPTYRWRVNNIDKGTNSTTFTTSSLNDGDVVTCVLNYQFGQCMTTLIAGSNAINVQVTASQNPLVNIHASANNIYGGVTVNFIASTTAGAGANYQWMINGINAGINSANFSSNALKNGDVVTCTVSGGTGCVAPTTSAPIVMTVTMPTDIAIPNTFTPNADGINDVWHIPALAYYPNCVVNVYNRYGASVYQSQGYGQPWDGTMNGKLLPVGTYYYMIILDNGLQKLSGAITIIR